MLSLFVCLWLLSVGGGAKAAQQEEKKALGLSGRRYRVPQSTVLVCGRGMHCIAIMISGRPTHVPHSQCSSSHDGPFNVATSMTVIITSSCIAMQFHSLLPQPFLSPFFAPIHFLSPPTVPQALLCTLSLSFPSSLHHSRSPPVSSIFFSHPLFLLFQGFLCFRGTRQSCPRKS